MSPTIASEQDVTFEAARREAYEMEDAEERGQTLPVVQPAYVTSRPNQKNRSSILTMRLSPEEMARVEQAAKEKHLPVSTMVRAWLLMLLDEQDAA